MELADYAFIWSTRREDYVLVRVGEDPNDLLIVHLLGRSGPESMMIDDDSLANGIIERMKSSGAPTVDLSQLDEVIAARRAGKHRAD